MTNYEFIKSTVKHFTVEEMANFITTISVIAKAESLGLEPETNHEDRIKWLNSEAEFSEEEIARAEFLQSKDAFYEALPAFWGNIYKEMKKDLERKYKAKRWGRKGE